MEQPQSQDQRDRLCPPQPSLWPCPAINKSTPLISTLTASWNRNAALASLERTDRWKLIKKRFLHIRYHNAQEDIWMIFFLYNKVVIIFNFSPGAKISWRLVQKWPRNKTKILNPPKTDPNKCFSQKSPRILNFGNRFLNPHINPFFLAGTNILRH